MRNMKKEEKERGVPERGRARAGTSAVARSGARPLLWRRLREDDGEETLAKASEGKSPKL
jgi:hypothetical protein